jgi:hypothetical protein
MLLYLMASSLLVMSAVALWAQYVDSPGRRMANPRMS